jgi:cell division protein FtsB
MEILLPILTTVFVISSVALVAYQHSVIRNTLMDNEMLTVENDGLKQMMEVYRSGVERLSATIDKANEELAQPKRKPERPPKNAK